MSRAYEQLDIVGHADFRDPALAMFFQEHTIADSKVALFKPAAIAMAAIPALRIISQYLEYTPGYKLDFILFFFTLSLFVGFLTWLFERDQINRPITATLVRYTLLSAALYIVCIWRVGFEQLYWMHACALVGAIGFSNSLTSNYILRLKIAVPQYRPELEAAHKNWRNRWTNPIYLTKTLIIVSIYITLYLIQYNLILPASEVRPRTAALFGLLTLIVIAATAAILTLRQIKICNSTFVLSYAVQLFIRSIIVALNYTPTAHAANQTVIQPNLYRIFGTFPLNLMLFLVAGATMCSAYYFPLPLMDNDRLLQIGIPVVTHRIDSSQFEQELRSVLDDDFELLTDTEKLAIFKTLQAESDRYRLYQNLNANPESWMFCLFTGFRENLWFTLLVYVVSAIASVILSTLFALTLVFAFAGPDIADLQSHIDKLITDFAKFHGAT